MYNKTPHYFSQGLIGSTQAHWSGEAYECHAAERQMDTLIERSLPVRQS